MCIVACNTCCITWDVMWRNCLFGVGCCFPSCNTWCKTALHRNQEKFGRPQDSDFFGAKSAIGQTTELNSRHDQKKHCKNSSTKTNKWVRKPIWRSFYSVIRQRARVSSSSDFSLMDSMCRVVESSSDVSDVWRRGSRFTSLCWFGLSIVLLLSSSLSITTIIVS